METKIKLAVGRPQKLQKGQRINVYLDKQSIDKASKLGDGNLSAGLRKALAQYRHL